MSYDDVYGLGAPCRVQLRWEGSPLRGIILRCSALLRVRGECVNNGDCIFR